MLLLAGTATAACEKNKLPDIAGPATGGASVKFFNFSVGSPSVNFFINGKKVTGVSTTACYNLTNLADSLRAKCLSSGSESPNGVAYGSAGNGVNAWYSDVAPGQLTITAKVSPTITDSALTVYGLARADTSLALSSVAQSLAAGKFYSFYQSGAYNATTKTTDAFIVEDVMPPQDFTVAYVRFVNASAPTQPMTLWAKNATTGDSVAIGGAVAYESAGSFLPVPVANYNIVTRVAGSSTAVFSRTGVLWAAGRAYTITARGDPASSKTMQLDNTANR